MSIRSNLIPATDMVLMDNKNKPLECIDLDTASNPRSVRQLVGPRIWGLVETARSAKKYFFLKGEREIINVRGVGNPPTSLENRLRLNFWIEYDRAQAMGLEAMDVSRICGATCTLQTFFDSYMVLPEFVAWMLCPPMAYNELAEEALSFGLYRMREILEAPIRKVGKTGALEIDHKLALIQMKIVDMLDKRIKGAVVQRNLNVNVNTPPQQLSDPNDQTFAEIQERLKQLADMDKDDPEWLHK